MAEETKVMMTVPQDLISMQVKQAVLDILAKDKDRLVRELVDAVLREPDKTDYYGSPKRTVLDAQIKSLILDLARDIAKEYVEALRPEITKEIKAKLGVVWGDKKRGGSLFAEKLVDALCKNVTVSINLKNYE